MLFIVMVISLLSNVIDCLPMRQSPRVKHRTYRICGAEEDNLSIFAFSMCKGLIRDIGKNIVKLLSQCV